MFAEILTPALADNPLQLTLVCIITLIAILLATLLFAKNKTTTTVPNKNCQFAFILHLDGTFYQEVTVDDSANFPDLVQQVSYTKFTEQNQSKQKRAEEVEKTCAVLIRPSISKAIKKLITENSDCTLLLTSDSSSTKERTEAMCQQLRVGGVTLSKLGFRVVPLDVLKRRSVASIRQWAGLDDLCLCIFASHASAKYKISGSDHIVSVPMFEHAAAVNLLHSRQQPKTSSRLREQWEAGEKKMVDSIFSATYVQPRLGVSLTFIRAFSKHHMKKLGNEQPTTDDVCEKIIKQEWSNLDPMLSFAQLVQQGKIPHMTSDMVGYATHFVSHAWQYQFARTVNTLECKYGHSRNRNSTAENTTDVTDVTDATEDDGSTQYFWIDVFSVPQNYASSVIPPSAWWATTFFHSISSIPNFVLVWYTWESPLCCQRAWCLWEIYAALHSGRNLIDNTLAIIMPKDQFQLYKDTLINKDIHVVSQKVMEIDVASAGAWPKAAKEMIMKQIRTHQFGDFGSGFDGLNGTLKNMLYDWVVYSGKVICDEMDEMGPPTSWTSSNDAIQRGTLCHSVAKISHQRTKYDDAEKAFRMAVAIREEWLGKADPVTMESNQRLACTIIKNPDHESQDEGIKLFSKVYACNNVSHYNKLRAQKMIGRALLNKGQVAEGVQILRECLFAMNIELLGVEGKADQQRIRTKQLKAKNGRLRSLFHLEKLLGTGLRMLGEHQEALKLHEQMSHGWLQLDGKTHDNNLAAVSELAQTLHALGRTEEAYKKMEVVVKTRKMEDGTTHQKTKTAMALLKKLRL